MKWIEELIKLRNELYEDLPKGEISSWELLSLIKLHINDLDSLIHRNSASLPSSSVTGEEVQLTAEEFAEGMMGLGKFDPKKWHHADAMLYNTIVKSVRYGAGEYSKLEQCHDGLKADLERCKRVAGSEITNLRQSLKDIASYNGGFIEYFRMHDYRLMYELWERVYGIATAYPVTGESEAIGERKFTLEDVQRLVKVAYTDASGIYKDVPCGEWWPEFKLHNNI